MTELFDSEDMLSESPERQWLNFTREFVEAKETMIGWLAKSIPHEAKDGVQWPQQTALARTEFQAVDNVMFLIGGPTFDEWRAGRRDR